MHFSSVISKLIFTIASILIILNAIFLSRMDVWSVDLFYYLPLFTLVLILDFMIYELNCPSFKGRDHLVFCTFPLSRWNIVFMEIKYYFKRWEFGLFVLSILFYVSYFYFQSNSKFLPLVLIALLLSLQLMYLIGILFLMKNLIKLKNLETDIKNGCSILITLIIIVYSFAGRFETIEFIFYINPLSSGFLSYLLGQNYAIFSYCLILVITAFSFYIAAKKISEWPLS